MDLIKINNHIRSKEKRECYAGTFFSCKKDFVEITAINSVYKSNVRPIDKQPNVETGRVKDRLPSAQAASSTLEFLDVSFFTASQLAFFLFRVKIGAQLVINTQYKYRLYKTIQKYYFKLVCFLQTVILASKPASQQNDSGRYLHYFKLSNHTRVVSTVFKNRAAYI